MGWYSRIPYYGVTGVLTGKAINKIIKICLVGTSEQPEVSLRRRGYYPGNRRTSPC